MVHHIRRGRLPADSRLVDVIRERTPPEKDRLCLVAGGWYSASLKPFLDAFGDGLLVLWQDDITTDPVGVYDRALRHIGASVDFRPEDLSKVIFSNRYNTGRVYDLTFEDRVELWDYFRDDVASLEKLLDVDLSRWEPNIDDPPVPVEPEPVVPEPRTKWWSRRRTRA